MSLTTPTIPEQRTQTKCKRPLVYHITKCCIQDRRCAIPIYGFHITNGVSTMSEDVVIKDVANLFPIVNSICS